MTGNRFSWLLGQDDVSQDHDFERLQRMRMANAKATQDQERTMMMHLLQRTTEKLLRAARSLESVPPFLARLVVGVVFATSGWGKVHNLEKVTAFFTELHIPAPAFQAVFVSYVELVCGSLLLVGLASRLVAVPLIISMLVAIVTAKAEDIHGVSDLFGTVEFTYIALMVWIVISGPGRFSLDRFLVALRPRDSAEPPTAPQPVRS
jgi:putative oxidoreductase